MIEIVVKYEVSDGDHRRMMELLDGGEVVSIVGKSERMPQGKALQEVSKKKNGVRSTYSMTVSEAAERAGVTQNAIRDAVKKGQVSGKQLEGRLMVHPTSLGAYKRKRASSVKA